MEQLFTSGGFCFLLPRILRKEGVMLIDVFFFFASNFTHIRNLLILGSELLFFGSWHLAQIVHWKYMHYCLTFKQI